MIAWKELDSDKASLLFDAYCAEKNRTVDCPPEFSELRNDMCELFSQTLSEIGISPEMIPTKNYSYQVDYLYGLKVYNLLNNKYGMNPRTASSAGVWRFLSIMVVPDIIELRYGIKHPDRFWKKAKRLWLRVLWWYIHLSWQGDENKTAEVLKDNSTDEILQLVDRCGRGGYRVELYRELMKQHSDLDAAERRKTQIFRKVMVLNTAKVQVVEPGLVAGGEKQYVSDLIRYFQ